MVDNIASSGVESGGSNVLLRKQRWHELGVHNYVKVLLIAGLFYYLFRNEISSIILRWVNDPSWSHGFLIPLFSLYFVNQRKKEILNLQRAEDPLITLLHGRWPKRPLPGQTRASYLGLVFLICALFFYLFNIVSPSGYAYFRYISIIAALGAVVLLLGGWSLVKYTWLPIVFLVFAVPLPEGFEVRLTMPMRKWAATVASSLLNLFPELVASNINPDTGLKSVVIDVFYKGQHIEPALNVAEACSGMRLLMAFLALGVAMAYLHYRPIWQRVVLLLSTIPIAILCNIVRVTVTGFIYVLMHPKYTQGIYHDALGLAMLPLAFGLYAFLAWFMSSLFIEESQSITKDIIVRRQQNS